MQVILQTIFEDDVQGEIIGRYLLRGVLYYSGRPQSGSVYADTEQELVDICAGMMQAKLDAFGAAAKEIYKDDKWEVRIYA